jgi:hypothetical protein
MILDGITNETIEQWIRDDQADTAERILLSLYEQVSILMSAIIELSDSLELITDILGNSNHVSYDLYWITILFNEYVHLKLNVAVQIHNVTLWISFLNPYSQIALPETRRFFEEYGDQLIQWGLGQRSRSSLVREIEEIAGHVLELRESVAHLTIVKEHAARLLRAKFSIQV